MRYAAVFVLTATLLAACNPTPENKAPTVTLAPAAAQSVLKDAPAAKLTATATDDGTIAKVEFLDGTTVVATDATAPYEFTPPTATVGEKTYNAKAYDDKGLTGVSTGVKVTVTAPIVVPVDTANVRVAHLSPDTPKVDIWLDGKVVDALKNVEFKTVSNYLKIPVGPHDIAVYVAGTTTAPAIEVKGLVLAKKNYTVAAIGLLKGTGDQALKAKAFEDDLTPNATKAKVRVIHASPDAPTVDVGLKGGTPADAVVKNLAYPNATSAYLELDPKVYSLEVRETGKTAVALSFDTPALEAGKIYTVFAINTLAKIAVLPVVDVAP